MSETYDFPDVEDIPKITTRSDDPYEFPETKNLFIQYDSEKWPEDGSIEGVIEMINHLFGPDVQVAAMTKDIEFLGKREIEEMLETLIAEQ